MSRLYLRLPSLPSFHHAITTFLGFMDLKIGAQILTLFALFNKIAGVYGIIAVFQGGTLTQVGLYVYSIATIVVFLWGLKGISDENPQQVLTYAHLFTLDHLISSFWTLLFAFNWYLFTAHDGTPTTQQSDHQTGLMDLIESIESQYTTPEEIAKLHHDKLTGDARKASAEAIWAEERGFASAVLAFGWLVKIYFALVLYSYALHLRHGTYRNLPLSKASSGASRGGAGSGRSEYRYHPVLEEEELESWSDDGEEGGAAADRASAGAAAGAASSASPSNAGHPPASGVKAVVDRLAS
ncbi:uncharacterized protein PFL1_04480 [Pseudozyma flocculosa PF-1]|uniref:Related to KEI1 - component of inositol phosphorylceramide synthase n=2 Tax=Pseudozyma flocculosa TaxID=84751 RepID=A0A5C3FBY3_9BASI|nr:uncharacterized protein PFL1_04480 [Pseudozyma flocculosa PF-1]EPQ28153.1 hypothetical protein PFL1_04480 [Pseudozyma flocculosa PF-1]SPO41954.1 related to KEI1 - component of inositol phosphorylceramide synthase [Pseudozyma flocculosa]